jgi:GNAT superfamily N-acetyltransferase
MTQTVTVRRFEPSDNAALTAMLHRAYAELGERGLNFTAVDQSEEVTGARAAAGACWVMVDNGEIVASVVMTLPGNEKTLGTLTAQARVPARVWLNQLGVDPRHRGKGYARVMRDVGFEWSRQQGMTSVGLTTALPAEHLVAMYSGWGFAGVDEVQWPGKSYRSIVMARELEAL